KRASLHGVFSIVRPGEDPEIRGRGNAKARRVAGPFATIGGRSVHQAGGPPGIGGGAVPPVLLPPMPPPEAWCSCQRIHPPYPITSARMRPIHAKIAIDSLSTIIL